MRPVTEYIRRLLSEMGITFCADIVAGIMKLWRRRALHLIRLTTFGTFPSRGRLFLRRGCFLLSHRLPFEGKLPFIKIKSIKSEQSKEFGRRALVERRGGPACREKGYGFYYSDLTLFASWPLKSDEICTPYP